MPNVSELARQLLDQIAVSESQHRDEVARLEANHEEQRNVAITALEEISRLTAELAAAKKRNDDDHATWTKNAVFQKERAEKAEAELTAAKADASYQIAAEWRDKAKAMKSRLTEATRLIEMVFDFVGLSSSDFMEKYNWTGTSTVMDQLRKFLAAAQPSEAATTTAVEQLREARGGGGQLFRDLRDAVLGLADRVARLERD